MTNRLHDESVRLKFGSPWVIAAQARCARSRAERIKFAGEGPSTMSTQQSKVNAQSSRSSEVNRPPLNATNASTPKITAAQTQAQFNVMGCGSTSTSAGAAG